jgi:hypothetical protein
MTRQQIHDICLEFLGFQLQRSGIYNQKLLMGVKRLENHGLPRVKFKKNRLLYNKWTSEISRFIWLLLKGARNGDDIPRLAGIAIGWSMSIAVAQNAMP